MEVQIQLHRQVSSAYNVQGMESGGGIRHEPCCKEGTPEGSPAFR